MDRISDLYYFTIHIIGGVGGKGGEILPIFSVNVSSKTYLINTDIMCSKSMNYIIFHFVSQVLILLWQKNHDIYPNITCV